MKLQIDIKTIDWWFWFITFIFIGVALIGWEPAYYIVMAISAVQIVYFGIKLKSLVAFDTQVRIVYFAFTLLGLIPAIRFPLYALLFLGTLMVVACNRCGIALLLLKMPWNKQQLSKLHA